MWKLQSATSLHGRLVLDLANNDARKANYDLIVESVERNALARIQGTAAHTNHAGVNVAAISKARAELIAQRQQAQKLLDAALKNQVDIASDYRTNTNENRLNAARAVQEAREAVAKLQAEIDAITPKAAAARLAAEAVFGTEVSRAIKDVAGAADLRRQAILEKLLKVASPLLDEFAMATETSNTLADSAALRGGIVNRLAATVEPSPVAIPQEDVAAAA
jgi:hypothetical protein